MKEKLFLKISIVISLLGILLILFLAENTELPITKIADLEKKNIDERVKIQGSIISIKETTKVILFTIKDETGTIPAILFKEGNLEIKKGQYLEIEGRITEYLGKKEVIVSKITQI